MKINGGIDYSQLFGTSGKSAGGPDYSSIMNLDLADVASVRNGSYGKLLKNYYKDADAQTKAVKSSDPSLSEVKEASEKLEKAADAFSKADLWKSKTVIEKDAEGNEKESTKLDTDAIAKAASGFVDAYNSAIKTAGDSQTKSVLRNAGWMDGMTRKNANMLARVGIGVKADGTLSLDEDKLKTADPVSLKEVFSGAGSFVSKVSSKAASLDSAASKVEGLYTAKAGWSTDMNSFAKSRISAIVGEEDKIKEVSGENRAAEDSQKAEEDARSAAEEAADTTKA